MLTEYDISFAVKEYLIANEYTIITWNPPGSQGTFTIPNPAKSPGYKGQSGSESPDLIAFKNNKLLILEAKDSDKKCISDIHKIHNLLSNTPRKELLFTICNNQMKALGVNFNAFDCCITIGIAIPETVNTNDILSKFPDIELYLVSLNNLKWNNKIITSPADIQSAFKICVVTKESVN